MKLRKFRVKNFKSIQDSGECWLASDITILAGKNESGKTALLEALMFGLSSNELPDEAKPLVLSNDQTEIMMNFSLSDEEIVNLLSEVAGDISADTKRRIKELGVCVFKYDDGTFEFAEAFIAELNEGYYRVFSQCKSRAQSLFGALGDDDDILKKIGIDNVRSGLLDLKDAEEFLSKIDGILKYLEQIKKNSFLDDDEISKASNLLLQFQDVKDSIPEYSTSDAFLDSLLSVLPSYLSFTDAEDILPFEIDVAKAASHVTVECFAKLANLNLKEIAASTNKQFRRNTLDGCSVKITEDFKSYWKQNEIELKVEPDGTLLRFGIKETGSPTLYRAEQRSRGFQWFLSFYIKLRASKNTPKIIFVDEPGLFLHAKAQRDVLNVLEDLAKTSQIILSTHSPYLLDPNRLDRIRLVVKDDLNGTKVENKIHNTTDADTLTPIITAIGLDLTNTFSIVGQHNILCEGISDYYFFRAMQEYLSDKEFSQFNLVPSTGASKIPQLASLLIGWNLPFVALLDFDTEGKRIAKELRDRLSRPHHTIVHVKTDTDGSTEDLFSQQDYFQYVLCEAGPHDDAQSNSKHIKDKRCDKVLLSKQFFESIQSGKYAGKLSKETVSAFKNAYQRIMQGFEDKAEGIER